MQKHLSKKQLKKEHGFDLHWSSNPSTNTYNALNDPHSNYFFVSKVAKQRLKELKLHLRKQKKSKSPSDKEMLKLIKHKIKFQFPKIKLPLLHGVTVQDRERSKDNRKLSEQFNKKIMTQRWKGDENRSRVQEGGEGTASVQVRQSLSKGMSKLRKSSKLKHQKTQKTVGGKVGHQDFLFFLTKKKKELTPQIEDSNRELP